MDLENQISKRAAPSCADCAAEKLFLQIENDIGD
jgi:hypothetical protein